VFEKDRNPPMTSSRPTRQQILEMDAAFMPACVIGAAAELDVWTVLGRDALSAETAALAFGADLRGTTILLDAVAALGLLEKRHGQYFTPPELVPLLTSDSPESILPMLLHRANCLRAWAELAWTVRAGIPAPRTASIRGAEADRAAFVAAMHTVSGPVADEVVARLGPPPFRHLLDVGGASGSWTLAFLRAAPEATATIFDLPDAIPQAAERIAASGLGERITLVAGDFYKDALPAGADFAWLSAIAHQHSRLHNRELFSKVFDALTPGGRIALRDVVMESDRTRPFEGALFAVNMLANTATGGTFTFEEFAEDLRAAGFEAPTLRLADAGMNSVVEAVKPAVG
jgi:SAM-dependent methyltransferase